MLKEIILSLTEKFHDLGHGESAVDHMIDAAAGRNAFEMDGIHGIGEWFDHMAKDFTSPDGIPLQFAEAIHRVTGMDMTTAIDWLCINAADVMEVGAEATLKDHRPQAYYP